MNYEKCYKANPKLCAIPYPVGMVILIKQIQHVSMVTIFLKDGVEAYGLLKHEAME